MNELFLTYEPAARFMDVKQATVLYINLLIWVNDFCCIVKNTFRFYMAQVRRTQLQ